LVLILFRYKKKHGASNVFVDCRLIVSY